MSFVAVGIDPTEGPEMLAAYRERNGYPWPVATGDRDLLVRYNVVSTAVKYAIDRGGAVAFAAGYGVQPAETWRKVFEALVKP